jgi:hypothetical protein
MPTATRREIEGASINLSFPLRKHVLRITMIDIKLCGVECLFRSLQVEPADSKLGVSAELNPAMRKFPDLLCTPIRLIRWQPHTCHKIQCST